MLPADTIAEITTNLAAQILAAVFAPLLRSGDPDPPAQLRAAARGSRRRAGRPRRRMPRY